MQAHPTYVHSPSNTEASSTHPAPLKCGTLLGVPSPLITTGTRDGESAATFLLRKTEVSASNPIIRSLSVNKISMFVWLQKDAKKSVPALPFGTLGSRLERTAKRGSKSLKNDQRGEQNSSKMTKEGCKTDS